MVFKEFGSRDNKTIILLHGGGLSWWSLKNVTGELQKAYHVVTPVIDGHGEDGATDFISIEESADKLMTYIDKELGGKVYAIGGLSLGAQITVEVLSKRPDICEYAIIESALVIPIKSTATLTVPTFKLFYGLTKKKWFAKLQAKSLCVPPEQFEQYYIDSQLMSKKSLINISLSNGMYAMKESIKKTTAKVLILVGSKEYGIMKKSAEMLHQALPNSKVHVADNMKHGEISLLHYEVYVRLISDLLSGR